MTESLAISRTSLREINGVFLSFWYFLFGTILSPLTSLTFENMFIPETMTDKICSIVHCTLASASTFLYIFAIKLLDANLVAIVYSIYIPLALTTQMFLLQSVTPPVELWVLVLGLVIITICVFAISTNAVFMFQFITLTVLQMMMRTNRKLRILLNYWSIIMIRMHRINLPNRWSKNQHLTGCGVFSDPKCQWVLHMTPVYT